MATTPRPTQSRTPYAIHERAFQFAVQILKWARRLPKDLVSDILVRQLLRAATSIGANIEEAEGALTAKDRTHSRVIARKEARETRYWLRLIRASLADDAEAQALEQETVELIKILSTLITKNVPPPR